MTLRSLSPALAALLLPGALHAAPVFLENVSESGGWYDCNMRCDRDHGKGVNLG